jgi:flavin-dependent dehydrogenase
MRTREYDVIVVGASFAGLAVARELRGDDQCRVRFLRATVTGLAQSVVETTEGRLAAPCVVDCSGWQGLLARAGTGPGTAMSFGLETDTAYPGEALYFWARPERFGDGIAWLFPTGRGSRVGLGSYRGATKLKGALARFVDDLATIPSTYHGTYFPSGLGAATAGRVFVVGDAAGHCLPFSAEGIRPALYFGQECGRQVQQVLQGSSTLDDALTAYRRQVEAYRWAYRGLALAQWAVMRAPRRWLGAMAHLGARPGVMARWWPRYSRFGALRPRGSAAEGSAEGRVEGTARRS